MVSVRREVLPYRSASCGLPVPSNARRTEYLYNAGYDPNCYVRLLEALARLEEGRPATLTKAFLAFPPTEERITAARKEIQETLPSRPNQVINTIEFETAKARLAATLERR